jgi:hypothetical protein
MSQDYASPKSPCNYPILVIEHTLRGGLYGALAGLVMCSRPQYMYKIAKVTLLGAGWAYMAEYTRCSLMEVLPWCSDKIQTAWIPGAISGLVSGSTVITAYRPALPPAQVAAFTAFSTMTYAMSGLAEYYASYEQYEKGRQHHMHAFPHNERAGEH